MHKKMKNNFSIRITISLLIIFSFCHCQQQSSFKLTDRKRRDSEAISDTAPFVVNCTTLFNSFFLQSQSIKRKHYISKLDITGRNVRFSDISPAKYCEGHTLIIQIFATEKIIIDRDYDSEGLDVTLIIAAPLIIVTGLNRNIILKGYNGKNLAQETAENGNPHGANGKEGNSGGDGGTFFALTKRLLWNEAINKQVDDINLNLIKLKDIADLNISTFLTHDYYQYYVSEGNQKYSLNIYVNGGDGGKGQNGGNGQNGKNGSVFNLSTEKMSANGDVEGSNVTLRREVKPLQNETYLGNGISEVILGQRGTSGGQGGNSGLGGKGGSPGAHVMLFQQNMFCSRHAYNVYVKKGFKGYVGQDGKIGIGGKAGYQGTDVHLSLYSNKNQTIELRNVKYYNHKLPLIQDGPNGVITQRREVPVVNGRIYFYTGAVSSYLQFLEQYTTNTTIGRIQKIIRNKIIKCNYQFIEGWF